MTAVKCLNCKNYWTIATKTPDLIGVSGLVCPTCISTLPRLETRRAA